MNIESRFRKRTGDFVACLFPNLIHYFARLLGDASGFQLPILCIRKYLRFSSNRFYSLTWIHSGWCDERKTNIDSTTNGVSRKNELIFIHRISLKLTLKTAENPGNLIGGTLPSPTPHHQFCSNLCYIEQTHIPLCRRMSVAPLCKSLASLNSFTMTDGFSFASFRNSWLLTLSANNPSILLW